MCLTYVSPEVEVRARGGSVLIPILVWSATSPPPPRPLPPPPS